MIEGVKTIPPDLQEALNFAVDTADEIVRQSLEFARTEYPLAKNDVIPLAVAHAEIAVRVLLARGRNTLEM